MKIVWIGAGVMGTRMSARLAAAGHDVAGSPRGDRERARKAAWADVIVTMVNGPDDVRSVYLEPGSGLAGHARSGAVLVDMTTSSPALAREIAAAARERGVAALDAPVSGGPVAAESGELSIMVGGDAAAFEAMDPVLTALGRVITHQGAAGAGQTAKLVNQVALAGAMLGLCEAYELGERLGADRDQLMATLNGGIVGSALSRLILPLLAAGDMRPGFRVRLMLKDLGLALDAAEAASLELATTRLAQNLYRQVEERSGGDVGTQSLAEVVALAR
jgi:3-hydroxyisobutyrate dehydrogenase